LHRPQISLFYQSALKLCKRNHFAELDGLNVSILSLGVMVLTSKGLYINNQWITNGTMWYILAHAF
jgi:hypothetical protein